jgi:2-isopropylmalate synthase
MDVVRIFDTTLRDGEQSPGFSMNTDEKIRMARQLATLGVDTIEAGFPISSRGDLQAVQAVAREVRDVPIAALARAKKSDIDAAVEALTPAASSRLHIFLATSDLHLQVKLHMTREQALEAIGSMIRYGRQHVAEVEFSAEDAGRTDFKSAGHRWLCRAGGIWRNVPPRSRIPGRPAGNYSECALPR